MNATLVTMEPLARRVGRSAQVSYEDLGIMRDCALVAEGGKIAALGAWTECAAVAERARKAASGGFAEIDARASIVLPGLIDAHTHALFAGDRIADFEAIAAGEKPPLGIAYTVQQTRCEDIQGLAALGARHLAWMAAHGTTTAEVKSGYALTADGECLMLRAMDLLDKRAELPHVVATFCGAHALPPEFDSYDAFVDELCAGILGRVASLGIARFADAFCESGYFSPVQSRRFLQACAQRGLRPRIHADELSHSGGAQLAAELTCISADHLNFIDDSDIAALHAAGCLAVLCPATAEYVGLDRWAPARALIDAGVRVALATDFNPGTSPCYSLQTVAHLARRRLQLSTPETVAALTTWPALSVSSQAGRLVIGAPADLVVLGSEDLREFGYYYGGNLVSTTIISCGTGRAAFNPQKVGVPQ